MLHYYPQHVSSINMPMLNTRTVDPVSEDNSLKIKACAKDVCKMHKKLRRMKH